MATRAYFVQMTGAGPVMPSGFSGIPFSGHGLPFSGSGLVTADVSPAQHAALIADTTNVTYLPIENASGAVIGPSGTFGDVSAANRTTCKTRLEAQHVPTQDFVLADLIKRALKVAKRRLLARQQLGADDFTEGLDTLVSAVAGVKQTAIANKLTAVGYDTSVIVGTDTIREALRKLIAQDVAANRTGDE